MLQCVVAEGPKSLLLHFTIQLQDLNFLLFSGKIQSAEAGQATLSLMTLPFQEIIAFFWEEPAAGISAIRVQKAVHM